MGARRQCAGRVRAVGFPGDPGSLGCEAVGEEFPGRTEEPYVDEGSGMKRTNKCVASFDPVSYWHGCKQRLNEAENALNQQQQPGPALTLAGVAAECAIRASMPQGAQFDGRHDMVELLKGLRRTVPPYLFVSASRLRLLWRNSYRYMGSGQRP